MTSPLRSRLASESGNSIIEFTVLAVLVMVPIAYVILTVIKLHATTYGAITAAREAGRSYVTSATTAQAGARARTAAMLAMRDQGGSAPTLKISCIDGACLSPGSRVRVEINAFAPLPFAPADSSHRGSIPVTAVHEEVVDTYRETR